MAPQRTWTPEAEEQSADSSDAPVTTESPGRYEHGRECGRGGQARVLLAMDRHLGREVAWKEMLSPADGGPVQSATNTAVTRFLREARITGLLEHPNIVPVHELGQREDGSLYYTMRIVRGQSLDERLLDCRDLEARLELLGAFWDMCNAVAFAHSKGVIHRDLKPSNVMVGEFGETVVLDWGLAKVRGVEDPRGAELADRVRQLQGAGSSETIAGWAVGTPSYMSPEQADGRIDAIDERSDVWGLGAVLYELLTGAPPYQGNNPYHVVAQVRSEPVTRVLERCATAPPELVAVATKALHRDPDQRYQSARELAEEVSAYMTGGRVRAYEYSSWELLRRFAARNKAAVGASAVVALAVLVSLVAVAVAWRDAEQARADERAQRLQAHFVSAQAYAQQADRLLATDQHLHSRIYAAASLLNNPANPTSPHHADGFGLLHPGADRLLVKASSRLYQGQLGPIASLEARIPRSGTLTDVTWSPDGRYLATAGYLGGVTVRDVQTGQDVMQIRDQGEVTYGVSFFPDSRRFAVVGMGPGLEIYEVGNDQPLLTVPPERFRSGSTVVVSPDSSMLVTRGGDGDAVATWDVASGEQRCLSEANTAKITRVDMDPGGQRIAAAAYDGPVMILDAGSCATQRRIPGIADAHVYGLDFSPDGERLLVASTDGAIRVYTTGDGALVELMESSEDYFFNAVYSPDGATIATAGGKGSVQLWDAHTGRRLGMVWDHSDAVSKVRFSPDGRQLASAGYDKILRIWNLKERGASRGHRHLEAIETMFHDPSHRWLATTSLPGELQLFDLHALGEPRLVHHDLGGDVYSIAVSDSGDRVALGGERGKLRLIDVESGEIRAFEGHDSSIWSLSFSPDGAVLASGAGDRTLRVWDVHTGAALHVLEELDAHYEHVAISRDGALIAGSGGKNEIHLWSLDDGRHLGTLEGHRDWVQDLAWVADTHQLVSASRDDDLVLWDADARREISRFVGHENGVENVSVHAPTGRVASRDRSGSVLVWRLALAEPELWLEHAGRVADIAFTDGGASLVVGEEADLLVVPIDGVTRTGDPSALLERVAGDARMRLDGFELSARD
jgi:WD40 repeat protein/tRNA A-37 threonylcarbamoyl transferase component Bud32